MEELALRTQPLHHVYTLSTEEAHIAAADVDRELFSEGALWENKASISFYNNKNKKMRRSGEEALLHQRFTYPQAHTPGHWQRMFTIELIITE